LAPGNHDAALIGARPRQPAPASVASSRRVVPVLPCLMLPEALERDTEATRNPVELDEKHVAGPLDARSHARQQIGREIVHGNPDCWRQRCPMSPATISRRPSPSWATE
jgi:hypothetical protein